MADHGDADQQDHGLSRFGVRLAVDAEHGHAVELSYRVLEAAPIGMALVDAAGAFHWVNAAMCELSGGTRQQVLGARLPEVLEGDEAHGELFAPVLTGQLGQVEAELRWRPLRGEQRWVSVHASLATDPDGAPLELGPEGAKALILQVIDITPRKVVEEEMAVLREELTARNTALQRSNEELEEFAYVASHDLSEPLRVIAGHVQLLADRYADSLDADAHEWIGFAVDGCARMRSLIDDLLTYSRVGRSDRQLEPVDCGEVVQRALWGLSVAVEETGASVEVETLPTVMADDRQLVQLFANLIGNSLKFRAPGRPPVVRVDAERREDAWMLRVRDNGIGVAERHRARVFKLFQRLHQREAFPGTGLGLAISRKIITRHGGEIWLEDGDDGGTAVCFTLPDDVGGHLLEEEVAT